MTAASDLFAQGHALMFAQFPAIVEIDGQKLTAASSGKRKESVLKPGGFVAMWRTRFWLTRAVLTAAGIRAINPTQALRWNNEPWTVLVVRPDPAGGDTLLLDCEAPAQ